MSGVWDNPSVVVIRAQDQPANPVDPENVNLPLMSQDIVVQIEIAIPVVSEYDSRTSPRETLLITKLIVYQHRNVYLVFIGMQETFQ